MSNLITFASCFSAVMPELSTAEIPDTTPESAANWDSVTTVSLIAVIEDEFGISIEIDDLSHFDSFQGIIEYLRRRIGIGEAAGESERLPQFGDPFNPYVR